MKMKMKVKNRTECNIIVVKDLLLARGVLGIKTYFSLRAPLERNILNDVRCAFFNV